MGPDSIDFDRLRLGHVRTRSKLLAGKHIL